LPGRIEARKDIPSDSDRARDQEDRARDQEDRAGDQTNDKPFERLPGHQYARNYPDPITGEPLQVYPAKSRDEFDSEDDFWTYMDAVSRWNNSMPPPRPMPESAEFGPVAPVAALPRRASRFKPTKSRHVGVRLTEADFELLNELARAHGVRPGTMARMLVVRGVRAAADEPK
jgi:hypothetical protein